MIFSKRLKYLREKRGLSQEALADTLGIPRSSITNYESDDNVRLPRNPRLQQIASFFGVSLDYLVSEGDSSKKESSIEHIPIYGTIKAGYDFVAEQNIIGYEITSKSSVLNGEYFYLIVKGDSMIDDGIIEGCKVLVRRQNTVENGKIGVVILNDEEATLKRVFYDGDNVILQAANKNISPKTYDISEVLIQGQVKSYVVEL
jgi:SOS-response transcriptional repressor LexA